MRYQALAQLNDYDIAVKVEINLSFFDAGAEDNSRLQNK
jgi:hypothetical protein